MLLKAFAHVLNHKPDTRLTIMGAGSEEANLKNLADELCLNNNVSFYGRYNREQFAQQLDGADTFVLASRGETFGVVYIEALSFGLPVIATHCGGPDDIVDESNGVLVDVDDVKGLAKAMVNMVDNIEKYDRNEISRRVRKIFSGESIAMQLTKIFSRILDGYYEKE